MILCTGVAIELPTVDGGSTPIRADQGAAFRRGFGQTFDSAELSFGTHARLAMGTKFGILTNLEQDPNHVQWACLGEDFPGCTQRQESEPDWLLARHTRLCLLRAYRSWQFRAGFAVGLAREVLLPFFGRDIASQPRAGFLDQILRAQKVVANDDFRIPGDRSKVPSLRAEY